MSRDKTHLARFVSFGLCVISKPPISGMFGLLQWLTIAKQGIKCLH